MTRLLVVGLLLAAPVAGCASGDDETITVMAAASLTDAFTELSAAYEARTGTAVELITAGSATLATQLAEGAPADTVALADEITMQRVANSGRVQADTVTTFATNHLVLAVPAGNPAGVAGIDDLDDRLVAVCAPQVPCGRLAAGLARANGVTLAPATEEPSVRSVRTKLSLAEVDAGFVYATDVTPDLEIVPVTNASEITTGYPIAAVDESAAGASFVAFVLGDEGTRILDGFGFGAPA